MYVFNAMHIYFRDNYMFGGGHILSAVYTLRPESAHSYNINTNNKLISPV